MTPNTIPTPEDRHNTFVKKHRQKEKENRSDEIRKKASQNPPPESLRREKNVIKAYVSDEEFEIIRTYVGDRSTSEVVRSLILDAATK